MKDLGFKYTNDAMQSDKAWDLISRIRTARGAKAKTELLAKYPSMRAYLYAAYNPFLVYGIKAADNWMVMPGECNWDDTTWNILEGLVEGQLSGQRATKAVKDELKRLNYSSGMLLMAVLNKSFSFNMANKTLNKVFDGFLPEFNVQLAHLFDADRVSWPVLVSPKYDGIRAIYKHGKFFSRNGIELKGLDSLIESMQKLPEHIYDGELMVDGASSFDELSGKIRSFKKEDNARFYIFDVPSLDWLKLRDRAEVLHGIGNRFQLPDATFVQNIEVEQWMGVSALYDLYAMVRKDGFEGIMVKDANSKYEGRRTYSWMKIKNVAEADCKVIDVFEGTGKYKGCAGGLVVDFNGQTVRVGSGLSDAQRAAWWDDPDSIIGATVEVHYQEETKSGSMRHPRLKAVRGDK